MTQASNKALNDENNQHTRWTHRKIIFNALKGCELTYLEIAAKVRLKPEQVWKRTSDMQKEDILIIVGHKEENGQEHSIYARNPNPTYKKYESLRAFIKRKYPNVLHEWQALNEHKL